MFPSPLLKANPDIAAIAAAEDRRQRAMLDADIAALRELLAEDAFYIHSSGQVDDTRSYLEPLEDGTLTYLTIDMRVTRAKRLSDDAYLLAGRAAMRILIHGRLKRLDNLFIMSWIHSAGGWTMSSWQSTPLTQAAEPVAQPEPTRQLVEA